MKSKPLSWFAGTLGAVSAALIGAGLAMPGGTVPTASAQATETVTSTTTTTGTATTTTTTATATNTATGTATTSVTASPTATATATQIPPTAVPTTVPPTAAPSQPANAPINLMLSGANEVPPVTTSGTGTFRATAGAASLAYTLTATASGITMAHIHSGAAGTNGPIVSDLIVPGSGVGSVNQSGNITVADLKGPMAGDMAAFVAALRAGTLYVNVHTVANPSGELRAQFPAPPGPPSTGTSADAAGGLDTSFAWLAAALAGAGALVAGGAAVARRNRQ